MQPLCTLLPIIRQLFFLLHILKFLLHLSLQKLSLIRIFIKCKLLQDFVLFSSPLFPINIRLRCTARCLWPKQILNILIPQRIHSLRLRIKQIPPHNICLLIWTLLVQLLPKILIALHKFVKIVYELSIKLILPHLVRICLHLTILIIIIEIWLGTVHIHLVLPLPLFFYFLYKLSQIRLQLIHHYVLS